MLYTSIDISISSPIQYVLYSFWYTRTYNILHNRCYINM